MNSRTVAKVLPKNLVTKSFLIFGAFLFYGSLFILNFVFFGPFEY